MTKRAELSTGEALVGLLEAYGVDTIFGIPGVHNIEMYRALPRSKIRHILTRHEQGAGFMADGYARVTGKPGVCFTITGPGLTNILTAVGQAFSDSSPMLVVSSCLDIGDSAQGRGRLHEIRNQLGVAHSVTPFARQATVPGDVRDAIAEAFAGFAAARPRPYYLEIPVDMLRTPAGPGWQARPMPKPPAPPPESIDEAVELLKNARQPVMILGGGARWAHDAAIKIAETLGATVITSTAGKGTVPESHPLSAGYRLSRDGAKRLIAECDVVLAAGTELSETDFWDGYRIDATLINIKGKLIRIDLDPSSLVRPHVPHLAILSDARRALDAIAAKLPATHRSSSLGTETAKALRGFADPGGLRTKLRKVLAVIRDSLPPETVVTSDMTQLAYAGNEDFPVDVPGTWIHPVGFGTLGFALPAGIGASVGKGNAPVAVMIGDYGMQYTVAELGTAAEHGLPIVVLLWNNDSLGEIHDGMARRGIQPNAVTLLNPNFQALAKAYHCHAEKPVSLTALGQAIRAALKADRPTVIEMTPRMDGI
jgi:thiamine pyrophosphate-dependent acetolactate synthase large subunit-like protein